MLLSTLEHHSATSCRGSCRRAAQVDVVPADRRRAHRSRRDGRDDARPRAQAGRASRMSPTCSARCSTPRARRRSRIRSARNCCSTAARRCRACRSTSPALGCDFYVFSGAQALRPHRHRRALGAHEMLDAMPPWQGGGSMIDRVTFDEDDLCARRRRGSRRARRTSSRRSGCTPRSTMSTAIGLDAIPAHEAALVREAREALRGINSVTLFGPDDSAGIVSFAVDGVHPHDIGTILDESGRRDPRRASLRPAADGASGRRRRRPGRVSASTATTDDIEALVRGHRTRDEDFRMNEEREDRRSRKSTASRRRPSARGCDETAAENRRAQARLSRGLPRSRSPSGDPAGEPGGDLYEAVIDALKEIYDPEIPVNIYDLGLIYGVEIDADGHAVGHDDADHAALPGRRIHAGRGRAARRLGARRSAMPRSISSGIRPGIRRR